MSGTANGLAISRIVVPDELTELPPNRAPGCTVTSPMRNEADSIVALLGRLSGELHDAVAEALFVDDTSGGPPQAIRAAGRRSALGARLMHRCAVDRAGGLGRALVVGLRNNRGPWAAVMDADLPHLIRVRLVDPPCVK